MALHVSRPLTALSLDFNKSADAIKLSLKGVMHSYESQIERILSDEKGGDQRKKFENTFLKFCTSNGHAAFYSAELTIPALVSGDKQVRAASSEAKKQLKTMWARTYSRNDLFLLLESNAGGAETPEEQRMVQVELALFRQAGAAVPSAQNRNDAQSLDVQCASLAFEIEQNINEDVTEVEFTVEELEGCSEDFISSLPGKPGHENVKLCSCKAPVQIPIMKRAIRGETRKKMMEASQGRCVKANGPLLDRLLALRHAAALKLGFKSHSDRMLAPKMAGSVENAQKFCEEMLVRLAPLKKAEHTKLMAHANNLGEGTHKRKSPGSDAPKDRVLEAWDVSFIGEILKRKELSFDDEKVKEYFPLQGTIRRLLDVYSSFLGLSFERLHNAKVWHEEVICYEVRNEIGGVAGHLYLDQFPRTGAQFGSTTMWMCGCGVLNPACLSGKFGHQMIVPLSPSFVDAETRQRCLPAVVNISNLPRKQGDKPALLRFAEMQTLFHELGHAMHALCATTNFSSLSWAWPMVPWPGGVEQDFLELPSMALEKFATDKELLQRVALHFSGSSGPILDEETIHTLEKLETWMVGTSQSRYFAMALFDLMVHSKPGPYSFNGQEGLSCQQLFSKVLAHFTSLPEMSQACHPCASWYHLVIGYDAGYYGYGWADVYAADLFQHMKSNHNGLLSKQVGAELRRSILQPCATAPAKLLIRNFLGRAPSVDAWCARKGLTMASDGDIEKRKRKAE